MSVDVCAVIFECKMPFLLRAIGEESLSYRLVDGAYIQGLMKGEVVKRLKARELQGSDMVLI